MPNIATALKSEISRLACKEIRDQTDSLKKATSQYRSQIAELKRRVDALERQLRRQASTANASTTRNAPSDASLRFRAAGFAKHRERLGLSAREMGLLLGASPLSVYKWEQGQSRPRSAHLASIAAVRKMGKREVQQRLSQLEAE